MQQQNVFLLDTCFWLFSAMIIYLIYPIIYCIIWAMKNEKIKYVITRIRRFTKKAMKMISSWFNVKHS